MKITKIDAYSVQIATTGKEFRGIFDNLLLFSIDQKESFSLDSPLNMVNFEISPEKIRIITGSKTAICVFEERFENDTDFIPYVIHVEASEFGRAVKKIAKNLNSVRVDIDNDNVIINHGKQNRIKIETKYTHPNGVEMFDMVIPKKFDFSYEIDVENFRQEIDINQFINSTDISFVPLIEQYKYVVLKYSNVGVYVEQLNIGDDVNTILLDLEKLKKCLSLFKKKVTMRITYGTLITVFFQGEYFSVLTMNDHNKRKSYKSVREIARTVYLRID